MVLLSTQHAGSGVYIGGNAEFYFGEDTLGVGDGELTTIGFFEEECSLLVCSSKTDHSPDIPPINRR